MVWVLMLLLGLCCRHNLGEPVNLNVIYVGSALENVRQSVSTVDGIWPAVQLAMEEVNEAAGLLDGYQITVSPDIWNGGSVMTNGSRLLNPVRNAQFVSWKLLLAVSECCFS